MSYRVFKRGLAVGCLVLVFATAFPLTARADAIPGGFDLFDPLPGSQIFVPGVGLVPVVGVPIASFPGIGANLGNTNSILERISGVSDAVPQTSIQMDAMQLISTDGALLLTLQALNPPPRGTMDVVFGPTPNGGTFTWTQLPLFFNVVNASTLTLVTQFSVRIDVASSPWSHDAPPNAVCIPQVNCLLNGVNGANDFFPVGVFTATGPNDTRILFSTAVIPEPGTVVLVLTGLAAIAVRMRKRQQRGYRPPS